MEGFEFPVVLEVLGYSLNRMVLTYLISINIAGVKLFCLADEPLRWCSAASLDYEDTTVRYG